MPSSPQKRTVKKQFEQLLPVLKSALQECYGGRLVAAVVFGSVGRGTPRNESDIDLLVVADPLPSGRMRRVDEFAAVKRALASRIDPLLSAAYSPGLRRSSRPLKSCTGDRCSS
jgi:predicted nucleotidyltransferase